MDSIWRENHLHVIILPCDSSTSHFQFDVFSVIWQIKAEDTGMCCWLYHAPSMTSPDSKTPQPGLPPKSTASCCLSARTVYWKQMDKDSWLSKFWCFRKTASRLLSGGQACNLPHKFWKQPYPGCNCRYIQCFSVFFENTEQLWNIHFQSVN